MSPECNECSARRIRCPVSVQHSPRACRVVKWAAAVGYLMAYGLIARSMGLVVEHKLEQELGVMLLLRTSLITGLFVTTMWALNHLIACAERGGFPAKGGTS